MIVTRHVKTALDRRVLAFGKVRRRCFLRVGEAVALLWAAGVAKAHRINRPWRTDPRPAKGRGQEGVEGANERVDGPLAPVNDLRAELCDDELKGVAILTPYRFRRGHLAPLRLEGGNKLAHAARKA